MSLLFSIPHTNTVSLLVVVVVIFATAAAAGDGVDGVGGDGGDGGGLGVIGAVGVVVALSSRGAASVSASRDASVSAIAAPAAHPKRGFSHDIFSHDTSHRIISHDKSHRIISHEHGCMRNHEPNPTAHLRGCGRRPARSHLRISIHDQS